MSDKPQNPIQKPSQKTKPKRAPAKKKEGEPKPKEEKEPPQGPYHFLMLIDPVSQCGVLVPKEMDIVRSQALAAKMFAPVKQGKEVEVAMHSMDVARSTVAKAPRIKMVLKK